MHILHSSPVCRFARLTVRGTLTLPWLVVVNRLRRATDQSQYLSAFREYEPLWKNPNAETSTKIRLENYERIFGGARRRVRTWERANAGGP
jgi:hypothetical protein